MSEAVKEAQKAFNDYATKHVDRVREYQGKLAFIKEMFAKDPAYMETLLTQEAEANADWLDEYYRLMANYKQAMNEQDRKKNWASKKDSIRAMQEDEIRMFGDLDEQIPWRHAKELGITEREYRKAINLPE